MSPEPKPPRKPGKGGPRKKGPAKPPTGEFDLSRLAKLRPSAEEQAARERRRGAVGKGVGLQAKIAAYERSQREKAAAAKKRAKTEAGQGKPKKPENPRLPGIAEMSHWQLKRVMRHPERHGLPRMIVKEMRTLAAAGGGQIMLRRNLILKMTPGLKRGAEIQRRPFFTLRYEYPSLVLRRTKSIEVMIGTDGKIIGHD